MRFFIARRGLVEWLDNACPTGARTKISTHATDTTRAHTPSLASSRAGGLQNRGLHASLMSKPGGHTAPMPVACTCGMSRACGFGGQVRPAVPRPDHRCAEVQPRSGAAVLKAS
jgi:hypothetical protein